MGGGEVWLAASLSCVPQLPAASIDRHQQHSLTAQMASYERLNNPQRGTPRGGPYPGPRGAHTPYGGPRIRRQNGMVGDGGFDGKAKDEEVDVGGGGFSSGKTVLVLAIVAGCFAVLWPKIFVPMIFGEAPHPVKTDDDGELSFIIISSTFQWHEILLRERKDWAAKGQERCFCVVDWRRFDFATSALLSSGLLLGMT